MRISDWSSDVCSSDFADYARGGHGAVWATPETLAIMETRYGPQSGVPVTYGEPLTLGEVEVTFVPAGHVLGSAKIVLDWRGERGSAERRVGKECVSTCRSRGVPDH